MTEPTFRYRQSQVDMVEDSIGRRNASSHANSSFRRIPIPFCSTRRHIPVHHRFFVCLFLAAIPIVEADPNSFHFKIDIQTNIHSRFLSRLVSYFDE